MIVSWFGGDCSIIHITTDGHGRYGCATPSVRSTDHSLPHWECTSNEKSLISVHYPRFNWRSARTDLRMITPQLIEKKCLSLRQSAETLPSWLFQPISVSCGCGSDQPISISCPDCRARRLHCVRNQKKQNNPSYKHTTEVNFSWSIHSSLYVQAPWVTTGNRYILTYTY